MSTMSSQAPRVLGVVQSALTFEVPAKACDSHLHVFGPPERFPFASVRPYTPGNALVEDLVELHRALRLERVVIVQPTVYGTDNSRMIDALRRLNGELGRQARGIAVVDQAIGNDQLERMHEAGVRGLRVNLVSKDFAPAAVAETLQAVASLAAPLGWHVQTYAPLALIAAVSEAIERLAVPLVVDHFGRPRASEGLAQPGFDKLLALVRSGKVYVKLSAAYRISDLPGYPDAAPIARALIQANPERMLWGTDWPHVEDRKAGAPMRKFGEIDAFRAEDNGAVLNRFKEWVASASLLQKILVDNPAQLYGF
jgi:predicted TIM-barrel fold metal-dependent hydrolase